MQPDPYFFGSLFHKSLPAQTEALRNMLFPRPGPLGAQPDNPDDDTVAAEMQRFLESQEQLTEESLAFMITALLPQYGSEYLGLFGGNTTKKLELLTWLEARFPGHPLLMFRLADCMLLHGDPPETWYPLLRAAMLADTARQYYPTADIFEALATSVFRFDFDINLLELYYQPCSEVEFEDFREDFLAAYQEAEQQEKIRNLRWKGMDGDT